MLVTKAVSWLMSFLSCSWICFFFLCQRASFVTIGLSPACRSPPPLCHFHRVRMLHFSSLMIIGISVSVVTSAHVGRMYASFFMFALRVCGVRCLKRYVCHADSTQRSHSRMKSPFFPSPICRTMKEFIERGLNWREDFHPTFCSALLFQTPNWHLCNHIMFLSDAHVLGELFSASSHWGDSE